VALLTADAEDAMNEPAHANDPRAAGGRARTHTGAWLAALVAPLPWCWLLSSLLAAGVAGAQSVVPAAYTDVEGPTNNTVPFDLASCGAAGIRYQQLYDGSQVGSGEITEVRFRVDGSAGGSAWQPVVVVGVNVRLATRALQPEDFGHDLDENLGGAAQLVYTGELILGSSTSTAAPRPFDLVIPLDEPFAFAPGVGDNLLMEIRIGTCAGLSRGLDAASGDPAVARAYVPHANGDVATVRSERAGLVTQFVMAGDGGDCSPGPSTLCLDAFPGDGRFRVEVDYRSARNGGFAGAAHAVPLESLGVGRGGVFWFFSADNPELLIKVLDGCALNDHYWVFFSAGTDVELDVRVEDLLTGATWTSHNPDGRAAPPVQDVDALPCV
jgi:hypothetical protein